MGFDPPYCFSQRIGEGRISHKTAQKTQKTFCEFCAFLWLILPSPMRWERRAELLPQIENSKLISVGRDRSQQHLSWVKCDPGRRISAGKLLVVIVECASQPAAFDVPDFQALRITGSE